MSLSFSPHYDANGAVLDLTSEEKGIFGRLRKQRMPDLRHITKDERDIALAIASLRFLDPENGHHTLDASKITLDHRLISRLDDHTATVLGLPPRVSNLVFRAETKGEMGRANFRFNWWWEQHGQSKPQNRLGAIIGAGRKQRIPAPIYDAIQLSEAFNANAPLPAHWKALADFCKLLGAESITDLSSPEQFLKDISIVSCDRVGLDLDDDDPSQFRPLPFNDEFDSEEFSHGSAALKDEELIQFQQQVEKRGGQPAFSIGKNRFLILDRTAMTITRVISEHAAKDEVSRRHFIENAERIVFQAVAEQLRSDGSLKALQSIEAQEEAFENTFSRGWAETREWSARVIEIRAWQKPVLETIQASGRNWLPADIDPSVGETLGRIPDHDVEGMLKAVRSALENALPAVVHETAGEFPATELIAEALERRLEIMKEKHLAGGNDAEPVLPISHDNFFELTFREQPAERQSARDNALPDGVLRPLQYHQRQAFNWQIECWRKGLPGILNADEQGLGKTLQTLAFLTWLTEVMRFDPKWAAPILIVAPTSLLRNWEDEIGKHLKPDIWGKPVRLYGAHLVPFKTNGVSGQDIQDGEARLDFGALMDAKGPKLAVTTYQTLANYAVSFAETRFAAIVYDEIQNLKNPATLRSTAARATHADFKIGLTGTPVENKTQDLWAIMDQLVPGALGSLVDFKDLYDTPTAERIRGLNAAVFTRHGDIPPLGQRRLKSEAASSLPPKVRIYHPRIMPPVQALRYDEARAKRLQMFALLHHIRRTSLHPGLIDSELTDNFTEASARLTAAIDILRWIKARGERALIFVEYRDVQKWLAELIRLEFDLERVDIINGETSVDQRKQFTDRFNRHLENDEGFDVLVLGPRAAGTGLTLTAANHVIHLTRWWNPAVEEQCNDRTHRIGQTKPVTVHIPLAIHPKLGRGSFDCLLQDLMRSKRNLADSVLWPQESNESELHLLHDRLVKGPEEPQEGGQFEALEGRDDLVFEMIGNETMRVASKAGGSSVVIARAKNPSDFENLFSAHDAALIVMDRSEDKLARPSLPTASLPDRSLWPDYLLPD